MYNTPFDQVKIRNFLKRKFFEASNGNGNDGLTNTTKNDVDRDVAFFGMLRNAGIFGNNLSMENFAAFTSNDKDHSTTVYVVNAPANSPIRQNFVSAAEKRNISMFYSDTDFPDLLFFIGQKGSWGKTNWLVPGSYTWGNRGTIVFYTGQGNNAPELS